MQKFAPRDFVASLLAEGDREQLASFSCGDDDLNDFVRTDAFRLGQSKVVQTYVMRHAQSEDRILGFVSLLADAVRLQPKERKLLRLRHRDHPAIPALKIARLGCSLDFQGAGVGKALLRFAFVSGLASSETVGLRLLTVDAYPDAAAFYERHGFVRNTHKDYKTNPNPSMRFDLFAETLPEWLWLD